ncbi:MULTISPECIES: hypothetical protein [Arsenophonus]|jgi:hypothetical protein|uniref:hypothetical protein n=1 Tax=Arsenophonus TaxID=637 RepID=UPI0015D683D6|nr:MULTISPECIES: hypothetical protein [Arsenophonus]UBX28790.1 hypothetical protein LDL57_13555 [Arsenophonus apicola]
MDKKYTVKVAPMGAKYIYQADKNGYKAGEILSSSGGHMWYVMVLRRLDTHGDNGYLWCKWIQL